MPHLDYMIGSPLVSSSSRYTIFADSPTEAAWFRSLSSHLAPARDVMIGPRGSNPQVIESLISYDRPDIILLHDNEAVLVVEKTREVPTGHNVGQRMARIVRAAELRVPVIKFVPFDAKKHGDFAGLCNLNIRLLAAFDRMSEIHDSPVLALNWKADDHGELVVDGSEDDQVRALVHGYLDSGHSISHPTMIDAQMLMVSEYERRLKTRPQYSVPPNSISTSATAHLPEPLWTTSPDAAKRYRAREAAVVYSIGMKPVSARREDPYTGMQFIYDYLLCRNGPRPEDKLRNLVLHFPEIDRRTWYSLNPNDPGRKSSNWYLTASALWFRDGLEAHR